MIRKITITLLFVVITAAVCTGRDGKMNEGRPKAVVTVARHEFQAVPEGVSITHEFIILNEGDQPLAVESVSGTCSCIAILSYDKQIATDARGVIAVRLDTLGYGGMDLERSIAVTTNEPGGSPITLTLAGTVEKVYSLTPKIAKLEGRPDERISASILIVPEAKYPFRVLAATARQGDHITFRVDETTWEGRPAFRLQVENARKKAGRYFDKILLTTDSGAVSTIGIGVFGHIRDDGGSS